MERVPWRWPIWGAPRRAAPRHSEAPLQPRVAKRRSFSMQPCTLADDGIEIASVCKARPLALHRALVPSSPTSCPMPSLSRLERPRRPPRPKSARSQGDLFFLLLTLTTIFQRSVLLKSVLKSLRELSVSFCWWFGPSLTWPPLNVPPLWVVPLFTYRKDEDGSQRSRRRHSTTTSSSPQQKRGTSLREVLQAFSDMYNKNEVIVAIL